MGSRIQIYKINIYKKIGAILFLSFIIQSLLLIFFYRGIFADKLIREINDQEDNRSAILQMVSNSLSKDNEVFEDVIREVDNISIKYGVGFTIKDNMGNTLYFSQESFLGESIQAQEYVKDKEKINYIIYGYFPPVIKTMSVDYKEIGLSISLILSLLLISFISLYLIYKMLTKPIKIIKKAVKELNYGTTTVNIPYKNQDEFGDLSRSFEEMGRRLKNSEDNQKEIISALSHDIKTPLTSILGFSKRLKDGRVKEEKQGEYYNTIWRKAMDIKELLSELDDYSDIFSLSSYKFIEVNAYEYFSSLILDIELELKEKEIKLLLNNKIKKDSKIKIDTTKIKRVFYNIIENSIKYSLSNLEIIINLNEIEESINISIKDNGSGVEEENIDKIFRKFFREEESRNRVKGGTGLGLSICKDIIGSLGGQIKARNTNPGLEIEFKIPKISG